MRVLYQGLEGIARTISEKFCPCEGGVGEANASPLLHDVGDGNAEVYTEDGVDGFLPIHDGNSALTISPGLREGASGDVKRSVHGYIIPHHKPNASTK